MTTNPEHYIMNDNRIISIAIVYLCCVYNCHDEGGRERVCEVKGKGLTKRPT